MRIRTSSLPAHPDCPRRNLAKSFGHVVTGAGFELRQLAPSIGAAVGTAAHAAVAQLLTEKRDNGAPGSTDEAVQLGVASLEDEVQDGAEWDDTTPNVDAAHRQIKRLTLSYARGPLKTVDPWLVETHLQADAGGGFTLDGHVDLVTNDRWVRDYKTGALIRPYQAQLGGYSLLVRSQGYGWEATAGVATDFVQRVPASRAQPDSIATEYPVAVAEQAALAAIGQVKRDVEGFQASANPWDVPANPMSMMCSPKYCPAFGTAFCSLGTTTTNGDFDID